MFESVDASLFEVVTVYAVMSLRAVDVHLSVSTNGGAWSASALRAVEVHLIVSTNGGAWSASALRAVEVHLIVSTNGGAWSASAGLPPVPVKCETDLAGHRNGRDVVQKRKLSFACRKSNHDSSIVQNRVELCLWSFCTCLIM